MHVKRVNGLGLSKSSLKWGKGSKSVMKPKNSTVQLEESEEIGGVVRCKQKKEGKELSLWYSKMRSKLEMSVGDQKAETKNSTERQQLHAKEKDCQLKRNWEYGSKINGGS